MTAKETQDCIKDLAFGLRRIGLWAQKATPAPETREMVAAVEKRLQAVANRLRDSE